MKLLVVSHACVTPINQEFFAEVEAQTGWDLTLITPVAWSGEYGVRETERWPRFQGKIVPLPVWKSGNVPLHLYRARFGPLLRRMAPNAIYVHHEPYGAATAQIYLANRWTVRAPIGFFTWQNIAKSYPFPFRTTEQMVYRQSAFAVSGSETASAVLRTKGYGGPLSIGPAGIDPVLFRPTTADPTLRLALGAGAGDVLLGYLGRLVPEKGLMTLLQALARVDDPSVKLALIGEGPQAPALDATIANLGLAGRVLRRGYVPHTEAPAALAAFDALMLPSETQSNWKEQFGRVIIEALACGTPVVGSTSGEIPHLIRRTGGGWTFPERDAGALSALLRSVAADSSARQARANAGRCYVHATYTHAALAASFAETVEQAVYSTAPAH